MKYVAIVENTHQEQNQDLVGQIIILDSELEMSAGGLLCYRQEPTYFIDLHEFHEWARVFGLLHDVSNVEIIGEL